MVTQRHLFSHKEIKKIVLGVLLEFGPIVIFLISFATIHIYKATFLLMVVTILSTILTYHLQKRIPYLTLYVAFITIIFGYLTLVHHNPQYIQLRDTLYDVILALTLLGGFLFDKNLFRFAFHHFIPMSTRAWNNLAYGWIFFFMTVAFLNELVRRNYSLDDWFFFKTAMIGITTLFGCIILYFVYEPEKRKSAS